MKPLITLLAITSMAVLAPTHHVQAHSGSDDVLSSVDYWSDVYGVSRSWMEGVVGCESGFDPNPPGSHIGPGQFVASTFRWLASMAGISGSPYDPDTNIRVLVWAHANGYSGQWACG